MQSVTATACFEKRAKLIPRSVGEGPSGSGEPSCTRKSAGAGDSTVLELLSLLTK